MFIIKLNTFILLQIFKPFLNLTTNTRNFSFVFQGMNICLLESVWYNGLTDKNMYIHIKNSSIVNLIPAL